MNSSGSATLFVAKDFGFANFVGFVTFFWVSIATYTTTSLLVVDFVTCVVTSSFGTATRIETFLVGNAICFEATDAAKTRTLGSLNVSRGVFYP